MPTTCPKLRKHEISAGFMGISFVNSIGCGRTVRNVAGKQGGDTFSTLIQYLDTTSARKMKWGKENCVYKHISCDAIGTRRSVKISKRGTEMVEAFHFYVVETKNFFDGGKEGGEN